MNSCLQSHLWKLYMGKVHLCVRNLETDFCSCFELLIPQCKQDLHTGVID